MSEPRDRDAEPLYTDREGVPTLFDVVLPGDVMRREGYVLGREDEPPAEPDESAEAYLERRIRHSIETVLPEALGSMAAHLPKRGSRRDGDDRD